MSLRFSEDMIDMKAVAKAPALKITPAVRGKSIWSYDREVSFHGKSLGQRAAIVAGGPLSNFAFAIVVLALLFMTYGQPFTPAEVGQVQEGSAAQQGGMRVGDVIIAIDGRPIERFEDIQQVVRLLFRCPAHLACIGRCRAHGSNAQPQ